MSAGRMATQRQRRGHRGDAVAAASVVHTNRADAGTAVTVHVTFGFRQRRGRKLLVAPDGVGDVPQTARPTPGRAKVTPAAKALARAFRWRRLIETGAMGTVRDIAAAESINPSYVSRILRLTLLAPNVVEPIVAGAEDGNPPLDRLMRPFPTEWQEQTPITL